MALLPVFYYYCKDNQQGREKEIVIFIFLIRINISYWNCSSFSHDKFKQKHKKLELKQEG